MRIAVRTIFRRDKRAVSGALRRVKSLSGSYSGGAAECIMIEPIYFAAAIARCDDGRLLTDQAIACADADAAIECARQVSQTVPGHVPLRIDQPPALAFLTAGNAVRGMARARARHATRSNPIALTSVFVPATNCCT